MDKKFIISNGINYMKSKSYHFPDGWIEACLMWLFEEHNQETVKAPLDKWCKLIEQQWLFTDLRDFEVSSIITSNDLSERRIFTGIVCLQIMQCEDVSKTFYGQMQSLRAINSDKTGAGSDEQNHQSRRSLNLVLTDGLNTINGFEDESWTHIKTESIGCGCKCQLKGSFVIINNVALLKQRNILILGGEVDCLKSISKESILEDLLEKNMTKLNTTTKLKAKPTNLIKKNVKKELKNEILSQKPDVISNVINPVRPIATIPTHVTLAKTEYENIATNVPKVVPKIVAAKLEPTENHVKPNLNSSKSSTQETCMDFEDDDDEFIKAFEEYPEVKAEQTEDVHVRDKDQSISLIDIFNELENPDSNAITVKQYKVKAKIMKFLTKLTTGIESSGEHNWKLQLRICDGTSSLDCQMSDGFMQSRIGFSANSFHEMKQQSTMDTLKAAIIDFQKGIVRCSCGLFTLQLSDTCDKIEIVNFADIDVAEADDLKARVARLL